MVQLSKEQLKEIYQGIPNKLTVARILSVPIIILLYPWGIGFLEKLAAFIFLAAALTDFFDGYLARKYDVVSGEGKLLDPIADKLLITAGLILLVASGRLYSLIAILIISRELIISGVRLMALENGRHLEVSQFGKIKTTLQSGAVFCLLVHEPFLGLPFRTVGMISIWAALFLTLYSGYLYIEEFRKA